MILNYHKNVFFAPSPSKSTYGDDSEHCKCWRRLMIRREDSSRYRASGWGVWWVVGGGALLKYLSRCGTTVDRVQAMWMLAALMVITVEISRMREGTSYIELQSGQRISEFNNRRLFLRKLCFQNGRNNAIQDVLYRWIMALANCCSVCNSNSCVRIDNISNVSALEWSLVGEAVLTGGSRWLCSLSGLKEWTCTSLSVWIRKTN